MHKLLRKQINRLLKGSQSASADVQEFLSVVNESYEQFESDYMMLERAMDLASDELLDKNASLEFEIQKKQLAEEALIESQGQLEERVKLRTAQLLNAKGDAEKANRAKSEFLARMSHELRTPLNTILGFSYLLMNNPEDPLSSLQKQKVDSIHFSGQHLLQLINDVLDLAKIESGSLDMEIENIDLNVLLENVIDISTSIAEKKRVSLHFNTEGEEHYFVYADHLRLRQVFLNIISNAIKYNREGGSVEISLSNRGKDKIRINFKDTGLGIPEEKYSALFVAFDRLGAERFEAEGTGIGLTISRELLHLMNGEIDFDSTLGEGSTFFVDLIRSSNQPDRPDMGGVDTVITANDDSNSKDKVRVLYIEDNEKNMHLMRHILRFRPNIDLLEANDALTGLDLAIIKNPDIILLDLNLPGMDGMTAFSRLSTFPETCSIPVIALTANAMKHDKEKAMKMGFKDYITKPIDIAQFLLKIDRVLQKDNA